MPDFRCPPSTRFPKPFLKQRRRPFVTEKQERLAIIRYVSVEYVHGLSKCQNIGYLVEVPTIFPLLPSDALASVITQKRPYKNTWKAAILQEASRTLTGARG
jgi:hypothetical protein